MTAFRLASYRIWTMSEAGKDEMTAARVDLEWSHLAI